MRTLHYLALALPLIALSACDGDADIDVDIDDDSEVDIDDDSDDVTARRAGTIDGRVDDEGRRSGVSGAVMTAFMVQSDGSLERIDDEETEVTTDANGEYSLDVLFDDDVDVMNDIIVRATSSSFGEGHVIVSSDVRVDQTTTAAPIDYETSLEAEVFIDARVDGEWDDSEMNTAFLRTLIGARTASNIDVVSDSSSDDDLDVFSDAMVSAMLTFSSMLESDAMSDGTSGSDLSVILDAMTSAQTTFDEEADDASTTSELDAAFESNIDAMFDAFESAGMSSNDIALSLQAMTETMGLFDGEFNDEDSGEVALSEMTTLRVRAMTEAIIDGFDLLDTSGAMGDGIESDGDTLLGDLESSLDGSGDIGVEIGDFLEDFGEDISADLESAFSLTTWLQISSVFDDAEDEGEDLRSDLEAITEVSVEGRADAVTNEMTEYALNIDSSSNTTVLTDAGLSESEAQGMLNILTQINVDADGSLLND